MAPSRTSCQSPEMGSLGARLAAPLLFCAGCTTALYGGPTRGFSDVARLSPASGTRITEVDGRSLQSGRFTAYEIEPGRHKLVASMKDDSSLSPALRKANGKPPLLCFEAEATHTYGVSVTVLGNQLHAVINDKVPGADVVVGGGCGTVFPVDGWDSPVIQAIYPKGYASDRWPSP